MGICDQSVIFFTFFTFKIAYNKEQWHPSQTAIEADVGVLMWDTMHAVFSTEVKAGYRITCRRHFIYMSPKRFCTMQILDNSVYASQPSTCLSEVQLRSLLTYIQKTLDGFFFFFFTDRIKSKFHSVAFIQVPVEYARNVSLQVFLIPLFFSNAYYTLQ